MPRKNIKFLEHSPVKLNFTNKIVTAYGGFAILAKLFEKIELKSNIERIVPFRETSPNSTGVFAKVLRLGLTVIAGGKRFTHSMFLGDSLEIYGAEFGVDRIPKSITAITRFFQKFGSWQKVEKFADALWEYTFTRIIPFNLIKEDYLSFDSSVITRYGNQEGAEVGYNPKKKGRPSHHPIMAFLNRSKYVVGLWNRPGSTASGNGIVEFAKQTMTRMQGRVKLLGCLADSGFYLIDFIKYLEALPLEYVIAAKLFRTLQRQVANLETWQIVDENISLGEFFFSHDDEKWDCERRYVVVRQKTKGESVDPPQGRQLKLFKDNPDYSRFYYGIYITSSSKPAEELWRTYRLRASDESIIKENKYDFGLEGFCLENFYATEAAMLVRVLFYNIINLFRSVFLPEQESKQTLHTLRMKYLIIPAVLGRDGKDPILRLGVRAKKMKQKIIWIINKIDEVFDNCIAFDLPPPQNAT